MGQIDMPFIAVNNKGLEVKNITKSYNSEQRKRTPYPYKCYFLKKSASVFFTTLVCCACHAQVYFVIVAMSPFLLALFFCAWSWD